MVVKRKYPIGAEIIRGKGVDFRIWCPDHEKVDLVLEFEKSKSIYLPMKKEKNGYFSILVPEAKNKSLYRFRINSSNQLYADPASRYQPIGPLGPSCVIDLKFPWTDQHWKGVNLKGNIIYELHIGTFTQEGTFAAAEKQIHHLKDLGITLIELMPVNDFPGHFGWGYDGVNLFAPCHLYGKPEELKSFINSAHKQGIGVILDVVYNHLGPESNHLVSFAKEYLSDQYTTDWGKVVNFDSISSREFFLTNAKYWIKEFHFDGLRADATPWFFCSTPVHILEDLSRTVKAAGGKRKTLLIGENEPQDSKLITPYKQGGYGFDMLWNDDFHHTALVRLTGKREAYYTDYLGSPQEFISSFKYGFLYQGQYYDWQKKPRGVPNLKIPPHSMVIFLENHDQLANSGQGLRVHKNSDPGNYKAMSALLLLSPNTPLLFQGQEFNSNSPFYYFADHSPELSPIVKKGRRKELSQFPRLATSEARKGIADPENPLTFTKSKLNILDKEINKKIFLLYKDLIEIRKTDPVFSRMQDLKLDGAVLGYDAFLIRYFGEKEGDRLLIINFGADLIFNPAPEPLLVPNKDHKFEVLWSSESSRYGGDGTPPINVPHWKLLGHSAIVLKTTPN